MAPARQVKITFAEMREQGVRGLLICCADHTCMAISGDRWPDDLRLSDIQDRFTCTACGKSGNCRFGQWHSLPESHHAGRLLVPARPATASFPSRRVGGMIGHARPLPPLQWQWRCGLYRGSRPGECTSGTPADFDQARADYETAWRFLAKRHFLWRDCPTYMSAEIWARTCCRECGR